MVAMGFTTTLSVNTLPIQVPGGDVGVTVYVAVTADEVVLLSVAVIVLPVPDTPPVYPVPPGVLHA